MLEQIAILCSRSSFLRRQESKPPTLDLWMPDQVRHDERVMAWLQPIVNRARDSFLCPRGYRMTFRPSDLRPPQRPRRVLIQILPIVIQHRIVGAVQTLQLRVGYVQQSLFD